MTDTLMDSEVAVGDRVQLINNGNHYQMGSSGRRWDLTTEEIFEVTRVYSESVTIRTIIPKYHDYQTKNVSFSMSRFQLRPLDPNAPQPRKRGQKPADTDDMIYVGQDDPGIQWLWDDMADYAKGKSWCQEYERIAAQLGIPGRPQDWEVSITVGGLEFETTVTSRTQDEAERLAYAALSIVRPE